MERSAADHRPNLEAERRTNSASAALTPILLNAPRLRKHRIMKPSERGPQTANGHSCRCPHAWKAVDGFRDNYDEADEVLIRAVWISGKGHENIPVSTECALG